MERRSFLGGLAAAGVLGLSGCTGTTPTPVPSGRATTAAPLASDDDGLRGVTAQAEQQLIGLYASALTTADRELAGQLQALQAQHVEHARRLAPGKPLTTAAPAPPTSVGTGGASGSTSADAGPSGSTPADAGPGAPSSRAVLATLRRAELAALGQRRAACERAAAPELVRDLCLIAASEAQHADILAALRAELPG